MDAAKVAEVFSKDAKPLTYQRHVDPKTGLSTQWVTEEVSAILPHVGKIAGLALWHDKRGEFDTITITADRKTTAVADLAAAIAAASAKEVEG